MAVLHWITYFVLVLSVSSSETCAQFHFPDVNGSTLSTSKEIRLSFTVKPEESTCLRNEAYILQVHKTTARKPPILMCSLPHADGKCKQPIGSSCSCPSHTDNSTYHLHHTLRRNDSVTVWVWSTNNSIISQKNLTISVVSPPVIEQIDTIQNDTRTAYLKVRVQADTREIKGCQINNSIAELKCCVASLTGTPPDLVLTVRLDNLTSQDAGHWTLKLTDDVGHGYAEFVLDFREDQNSSSITESTGSTEVAKTSQDEGSSSTKDKPRTESATSLVTASAAAIVAVVVVVIAVWWACRRRDDSRERLPALWDVEKLQSIFSSQQEMTLSRRLARSEECVMVPNFLYNGSRSLPEIAEGPYAEIRDHGAPNLLMNIDNRPPAPLPCEDDGEGNDYTLIDDDTERCEDSDVAASANDCVPTSDIMESKKQTQFEDLPEGEQEGEEESLRD